MKLLVYILNFFLLIGLIFSHFVGKVTAQQEFSATSVQLITRTDGETANMSKSIYDYSFTTLDGKKVSISEFKGKKILFVNTASQCGFTPQYKQLEEVYQRYKGKLIILGFPTNDFGQQEPGNNGEIKEFCTKNFGVTFPMSQKITVKGDGMAPVYKWLTKKELNGKEDSDIKWNFQKYLIDENGKLVTIYKSSVKPDDKSVEADINK